ncbi:hypothetical protein DL98DRAFT_533784 [Cadophora sp. DSE1049]|nr:hypothetical protein DL98DRAFT_533784 [Cadophora sp. DSE1049]
MHCPHAIYEDAEDITCPMAREIKDTGWSQIKNWCVEGPCRFCDKLCHYNNDDDDRSKYRSGFLIWPMGHQGTIWDVQALERRDLPPQMPLYNLPEDVVQLILRFMLVAQEPITNPHLQNKIWYERLPSSQSGGPVRVAERGVVKYTWSKYLRPAMLATCDRYYRMGVVMLYQYNTFHFTRLVSQANNLWADRCTLGPSAMAGDNPLNDFLAFKHRLFISSNKTLVSQRSRQFKIVIIHDSDNDNDFYAKRGIDLIITIDEEEPEITDHLRFEQKLISRSWSSTDEGQKWGNPAETAERKSWAKNWSLSNQMKIARGMHVEHILVRGTDALGGGNLRFNHLSGRTAKLDSINISGRYLPTSKVAKGLIDHLAICYNLGFLINHPVVSFTGKLNQRQLMNDGSFVEDEKLDQWLAENFRRESQIRDTEEQQVAEFTDQLPYFI